MLKSIIGHNESENKNVASRYHNATEVVTTGVVLGVKTRPEIKGKEYSRRINKRLHGSIRRIQKQPHFLHFVYYVE